MVADIESREKAVPRRCPGYRVRRGRGAGVEAAEADVGADDQEEEYDEGIRLGAAGDGDGGGAAGRRIEVPDDVLKQVVSGLNESSAAGCSLLGYKEIKDPYHHGYTRGRSSW